MASLFFFYFIHVLYFVLSLSLLDTAMMLADWQTADSRQQTAYNDISYTLLGAQRFISALDLL
jgi:hypothetical protein